MEPSDLEKLLGRSLTPSETVNLDSYEEITQEAAQSLLCMNLSNTPTNRTFDIREGYSTVFTDLFKAVSEVKVDGTIIDSSTYYTTFWDDRNLSYKNSLIIDSLCGSELEVTADWGFDPFPLDLQKLLARAYAQAVAPTAKVNTNIKNKRVEDFSVTYGDLTSDEVFMTENASAISKYSKCNVGFVRHGKTCDIHGRSNCGYCL